MFVPLWSLYNVVKNWAHRRNLADKIREHLVFMELSCPLDIAVCLTVGFFFLCLAKSTNKILKLPLNKVEEVRGIISREK